MEPSAWKKRVSAFQTFIADSERRAKFETRGDGEQRANVSVTHDLSSRFDITDHTEEEAHEVIREAFGSVPSEFRASARLSVSADIEYGEPCLYVDITYAREETDEERTERLAYFRQKKAAAEAQEREAYEALKEKYGG